MKWISLIVLVLMHIDLEFILKLHVAYITLILKVAYKSKFDKTILSENWILATHLHVSSYNVCVDFLPSRTFYRRVYMRTLTVSHHVLSCDSSDEWPL